MIRIPRRAMSVFSTISRRKQLTEARQYIQKNDYGNAYKKYKEVWCLNKDHIKSNQLKPYIYLMSDIFLRFNDIEKIDDLWKIDDGNKITILKAYTKQEHRDGEFYNRIIKKLKKENKEYLLLFNDSSEHNFCVIEAAYLNDNIEFLKSVRKILDIPTREQVEQMSEIGFISILKYSDHQGGGIPYIDEILLKN